MASDHSISSGGGQIGSLAGNVLNGSLGLSKKKGTKTEIVLAYGIEAVCVILVANIATNLYGKFKEYRADTEAIRFLQNERDYGALRIKSLYFSRYPTSLEKLLGASYLTEIVDTLVTASTFGKITYFGGHPSYLSRAARFEKAAQELEPSLRRHPILATNCVRQTGENVAK